MAHPYWPLFDLRIQTPLLELRLPTDDDIATLIDRARNIAGAPGAFLGPWAALPEPSFSRDFARFHWHCRASWKPDEWELPLAVVVDGDVVGSQGIGATSFARVGEVSTGSWLDQAWAGRGIGSEMRAAILHLAFDGLGAVAANSGARQNNPASLRVSEKLGYESNGHRRLVFGDDTVDTEVGLRLTRERWLPRRRDDVAVTGLEDCLDLFGVDRDAQATPSTPSGA